MKKLLAFGSASAALCCALTPTISFAQSSTISVRGKAAIVGEITSVRAKALLDASHQAVKQLIIGFAGANAVQSVSEDTIDQISQLIPPSAIRITNQEAIDGVFVVSASVSLNVAEFTKQFSNFRIKSSRRLSTDGSSKIVIMVDLTHGASRDLTQPREISYEASTTKGASYSDKSAAAVSAKDKESSAYNSKAALSERAASAAAASSRRGQASAASAYSESAASATTARQASSSSYSAAQKNNVQAEVHDDSHTSIHIINQDTTQQTTTTDNVVAAIKETTGKFDLSMEAANKYYEFFIGNGFKGNVPSFQKLSAGVKYNNWLQYLASRGVKYFAGGELDVSDGAKVGTRSTCTGVLTLDITSTKDGDETMDGARSDPVNEYGDNASDCQTRLITKLSQNVGAKIGQAVQTHIRERQEDNQDNAQANATAAENTKQAAYSTNTVGADYTITFRAANIDYATAKLITDSLRLVPGIDKIARTSMSTSTVTFQAHYKADVEIDGAIMDRLTANPTLASLLPSQISGTSVIFCIGPCPK